MFRMMLFLLLNIFDHIIDLGFSIRKCSITLLPLFLNERYTVLHGKDGMNMNLCVRVCHGAFSTNMLSLRDKGIWGHLVFYQYIVPTGQRNMRCHVFFILFPPSS